MPHRKRDNLNEYKKSLLTYTNQEDRSNTLEDVICGALDEGAARITLAMKLSAAHCLAQIAASPDPDPDSASGP